MMHELEFEYEGSIEDEYCTRLNVVVQYTVESEVDYTIESITLYDEQNNEIDIDVLPSNEQKQIDFMAIQDVEERCYESWQEYLSDKAEMLVDLDK